MIRRFTPAFFCLLYAVALLALRNRPLVLAHWVMLLQLPRAVAFGWALAVALRGRLTPSARIGAAMALGGGLCVAGGLWETGWGGVRVIAAMAWVVAAWLAYSSSSSGGGSARLKDSTHESTS